VQGKDLLVSRDDSRRYVTAPELVHAERGDGSLSLYHPGHGTSLDVEPESRELVARALEGFAEPSSLDAFVASHPDFPEPLLDVLVRACFLVDEREAAFLQHGFLRPVPAPLGLAWSWADLPDQAQPGTWLTLGVPVDLAAAGQGGARHGPAEIRKVVNGPLLSGQGDVLDHELGRLYPEPQLLVADLGDIDPDGGRMDHVGARVVKVVREALAYGLRPLVLGGDHGVTHYVLKALIERGERFGILHFDAHHDLGPSTAVSHANVFSEALASDCVASLVQIGLRVIERVSPYAARSACPKRTIVTARQAREGHAQRVLEALPRDMPWYLTFDIDCIDAAVARETGTPAHGGLSAELATDLVDLIARRFVLLGADFVEISGAHAPPNAAALIAAGLLQRVLLGECPFEPLPSDIYSFPR
jgi:arginase family enzyme